MPEELGDGLVEALDALIDAVEANAEDEKLLLARLSALRQVRRSVAGVTEALAQEADPGTLQVLGRILSRLTEASGIARRALAGAMRAEGTSIPAIAQAFGVTHQRVSNILSRPPAVPRPVLHHPTQGRGDTQDDDQEQQRFG